MAPPIDSPIPLKAVVEEEDLPKVELPNRVYLERPAEDDMDDGKKKARRPKYVDRVRSVAIFQDGTLEGCLRLCHEFKDLCKPANLSLDAEEHFTFFRQCLGTYEKEQWDLVLDKMEDVNHNLAAFEHARTHFIENFASHNDLAKIKRMIDRASKPVTMTVSQLFKRVQFLNLLLRFFPGCDGISPYPPVELKDRLYNMMLAPWQDNFLLHGHSLNKMSILELQQLMTEQEKSWNKLHPIQTKKSNGSASNNNSGSSQTHGRSSGRRRRRGNDSSNNGRNVRQRRGNGQGNGPNIRANGGDCRNHPGLHDWLYCYANPNGPNYRPDYRPRQNQGRSQRPSGNGGNPNRGPAGSGSHNFAPPRDAHMVIPPPPGPAPQPPVPPNTTSTDAHWLNDDDIFAVTGSRH